MGASRLLSFPSKLLSKRWSSFKGAGQKDELVRSPNRNNFILKDYFAPRYDDISRAVLDEKPDIIHFSSHGERGKLIIEGENLEPFSFKFLSDLLEENKVRAIILNACYSSLETSRLEEYSEFVIGCNLAVGDEAACEFTKGFIKVFMPLKMLIRLLK